MTKTAVFCSEKLYVSEKDEDDDDEFCMLPFGIF